MNKNKETIEKQKNINKKELRNRIIIYTLLIIVSIYIIYTIFLLIKQPTDTFTVEEGDVYQEETDVGYVIRKEQVVKGENYANGMEKIKAEGEKVAKNEAVYRYYSANEGTLKSKISELDTKIQKVMESETGIYPADMKFLENQIDEKVEEIKNVTDTIKLQECKREINELITKKAKIAGDLSPKGSYLNQLIEERSKYENQLNSGAEYIKAPESGIVSYKVDGLENKLTPNNFPELSKEYLEKLDLKTGKIIATNDECGKIIDIFNCYIATISNSEESKNAKIGDKLKIRLSNNLKIDAKIINLIPQNNGEMLIILEFNKQIGELSSYRKISCDLIWWEVTGLKVPNKAIIEENGLSYVVRNRAGYLNKILIKVAKQNENYSIIKPYTTEELRQLGISQTEINNYKKISIYDEVILNPDLSKIKE